MAAKGGGVGKRSTLRCVLGGGGCWGNLQYVAVNAWGGGGRGSVPGKLWRGGGGGVP